MKVYFDNVGYEFIVQHSTYLLTNCSSIFVVITLIWQKDIFMIVDNSTCTEFEQYFFYVGLKFDMQSHPRLPTPTTPSESELPSCRCLLGTQPLKAVDPISIRPSKLRTFAVHLNSFLRIFLLLKVCGEFILTCSLHEFLVFFYLKFSYLMWAKFVNGYCDGSIVESNKQYTEFYKYP